MLDLIGYQNNFVWWMGVVEDRQDPERIGRCRVRMFGIHPSDKNKVPTADLPWAHPVSPITNASMSGIGESPVGPVEGTHVFGFFRDGDQAQYPVMLGTIPGIPQDPVNVGNVEEAGFQDPGEKYPKDTERHGLEESDVSRLARYRWTGWDGEEQKEDELPPLVKSKIDNRVTDVPVANSLGFFSEPPTKYDAKYPLNHVSVSESGHVREVDDTPGKERLHEYHRSGTFTEIYPKGTRVQKVVRDNYEFTLGDNYVNIKKIELDDEGTAHGGNLYITIEGDVNEFVQGNVTRQINGDLKEYIGGNYNTHVNGDRTINIEGSEAIKVHGDETTEYYNLLEHVIGGSKRYCESEVVIDSPRGVRLESSNINLVSTAQGAGKGQITLASDDITDIRADGSVKISSQIGGVAVESMFGDVVISSARPSGTVNILSAGAMTFNAGERLAIISGLNMYLGCGADMNMDIELNQVILAGQKISQTSNEMIIQNISHFQNTKNTIDIKSENTFYQEAGNYISLKGVACDIQGSFVQIDGDSNINIESGGPNVIKGTPVNIN